MVGSCRIVRPRLFDAEVRLMRLQLIWLSALFLLLPILLSTKVLFAEEKTRIAVMPLKVHALKATDGLEPGFEELLSLSLADRGFDIISPEEINRLSPASLPVLEIKDVLAAGRDLNADWVITGSLTRIGKKASLDLRVIDIGEKRPPFSLYMTAEDIDSLEETAKRIAVSIDNRISGVAQIDSIQVRGNRRVEEEAILAVVETKR